MSTRLGTLGQCPEDSLPGSGFAAGPGVPASADVDADGRPVDTDALLDQPVRRRRGRQAGGFDGQAPLLGRDPAACPLQILELHPLKEAEQGEAGQQIIGHKFESTLWLEPS